jgi:para-aminobenzoate synthetase component 1
MLIRDIGWRAPAGVFAVLRHDPHVAWLDSGGAAGARSRYSYLATDPFLVLEARGEHVRRNGEAVALDPFAALAADLARFGGPPGAAPVPFAGGAIGFLGYELAPHLERVPRHAAGGLGLPDMAFGFYDVVVAFDHLRRQAWVIASGLPATDDDARRRRAAARADALLRRLDAEPQRATAVPALDWRRETSRARYEAGVARVRDYIRAGDIFQANHTTRFLAPRPAGLHAADLYAVLRAQNPAPFGAFLDCGGGTAIASASPERFLRLDAAGRVETRPIKGTRPRGISPEQDAALRAALAESVKDHAENLMIVDLLRNDLGRVARFGSVRVPQLAAIESFPAVHHLVSAVEARLRPGLGPVDLLRATFPGGSITGAPKIRAMEIIAEREDAARGPYCGSIAWIGWDGAMDSSIVIRTAVVGTDTIAVQAGGGIVWDSDPAEEYAEMMVKAAPLLRALGRVPA